MKKIAIILSIGTILTGIYAVVQVYGSEHAILERFPDIDPTIARKAHKIMLKRTLDRQYIDLEFTDEECDQIFLDIVQELIK